MSNAFIYIKEFKRKSKRFKKGPIYINDMGLLIWDEKYSFLSHFKLNDSNRMGGPCQVWPDGRKLDNKNKLRQEPL